MVTVFPLCCCDRACDKVHGVLCLLCLHSPSTRLKKFLGKSVKRAKHLAEEYGEKAVNKVKSVRDEGMPSPTPITCLLVFMMDIFLYLLFISWSVVLLLFSLTAWLLSQFSITTRMTRHPVTMRGCPTPGLSSSRQPTASRAPSTLIRSRWSRT